MTADETLSTSTPDTSQPTDQGSISADQANDAAMEAAWNELQSDEGQDRAPDGKFKGKDTETAELEGAAGAEEKDGNLAVANSDIPLPANLHGLEEEWGTLPLPVRQKLAERTQELHTRMSDMGRQVGTLKPVQEAMTEFAEYFNGTLKDANGAPIQPADGLRYLANIQRSMDKDPPATIMNIIDTYKMRDQVARLLGVQAAPQQQDNRLLGEISALKQQLASLQDPAKIEKVIDDREARSEISRLLSSDPLIAEIPEKRLAHFIEEGWEKLGGTATREAVLKYAVKVATEADPALRAKAQAAQKAAQGDKQKAEAAKRATGVNVTSTSSGKSRPMTDDEAMEAKWSELQSAH